jgi:GntR family transcriptional regulator, arabinose operon transcriptional repressor
MSSEFPYQKIESYLREAILCGDFPPGAQIPSQRELSETFGVSRAPVLKALAVLIQEGLLHGIQGSGVFVADKTSQHPSGGQGEIALLIPSYNYYAEFIRPLTETLSKQGYVLRIYMTGYHADEERDILQRILNDPALDGVLMSPESNDRKMREFYSPLLAETRKPLILINRRIPELDMDFIEYDYVQGGRILADYLLKAGLQKILFHGADPRRDSWRPRLEGLTQRLKEDGINGPVETFPMDLGPVFVRRLSEMLKHGEIDVVVGADDNHAAYIYNLLLALDKKIPDDVAMAGFDDRECAAFMSPPLTTVAPAKQEAGQLAAEHILHKIANPAHRVQLALPCKLILRGSCAPAERAMDAYPFGVFSAEEASFVQETIV